LNKIDKYKMYKLDSGVTIITFVRKDTECPIKNKQGILYKFKIDINEK
jgi:hypothetical protein